MAAKKKSERKTYHHGDLRQAVVLAAVQIIRERGDVSFTIRELANLTGVSHPAVYRHFINKRAVLAAVAEEGFHLLLAELRKAEAAASVSPVQVLKAQAENYLNFAFDHIGHFRAMYHAELSDKSDFPTLAQSYEAAGNFLMANFSRGLASGVFQLGKPETLTLGFWAMVHGLVDLTVQGQLPLDLQRDRKLILKRAGELVDLLLIGLLNDASKR